MEKKKAFAKRLCKVTKLKLNYLDIKMYHVSHVWKRRGEGQDSMYTFPTVKHGGDNIMLRGWLAASRQGSSVKVKDIMEKEQYVKILSKNLKDATSEFHLSR